MEVINFLLSFNDITFPAKIEIDDEKCTLTKFVQIEGDWVDARDLPKKGMLPLFLAADKMRDIYKIKEGATVTL